MRNYDFVDTFKREKNKQKKMKKTVAEIRRAAESHTRRFFDSSKARKHEFSTVHIHIYIRVQLHLPFGSGFASQGAPPLGVVRRHAGKRMAVNASATRSLAPAGEAAGARDLFHRNRFKWVELSTPQYGLDNNPKVTAATQINQKPPRTGRRARGCGRD